MKKNKSFYICFLAFFITFFVEAQTIDEQNQVTPCPGCNYFSNQTQQAQVKSVNALNAAQLASQQANEASQRAQLAQTSAAALSQLQAQAAANEARAQAQQAQQQAQQALAQAQAFQNQVQQLQATNASIAAQQGQATAAQAALIQNAVNQATAAQTNSDAAAAAAANALQRAMLAQAQASGINNAAAGSTSGSGGPPIMYNLIPRASPRETTPDSSNESTPFMTAIKLYSKETLTLDEAYKVIRHYIDIVIPDAPTGRKLLIQHVIGKVANGLPEADKANAEYILANYMMGNGLRIDIAASAKSPVNVDLTAVTPSSNINETNHALKVKFMAVYGELMKSPKFKELFIDLFNDNSKPRAKFEIANLPNNVNGNTVMFVNNPLDNKILIDTDLLLRGNSMAIAKTIIHECIHAYLNMKLSHPNMGMSIPGLNNMDLQKVINTYYNGFKNDQDQHNFIYNYMLPTMQTILSEVKDLLVSPTDNAGMLDLSMHIPLGAPTTPFNWNEFYKNLSLNGLQECTFFKNEIGTFNVDGSDGIIVDKSKMDSYNQYNKYSNDYLNK